MRWIQIFLACAAILAFGAGAAAADCREELAQLSQGLSKDGSRAPLQSGEGNATPQQGASAATGAADTPGVAKDGTEMPVGTDPNLATSPQDAQAQSEGGATAAAQALGAAAAARAMRMLSPAPRLPSTAAMKPAAWRQSKKRRGCRQTRTLGPGRWWRALRPTTSVAPCAAPKAG